MKGSSLRYGFMLGLLAGAALLSVLVRQGQAVPLRKGLGEFPQELGPWKGRDLPPFSERVLNILKASDYLNRVYVRDGEAVSFYVGYYEVQRAGESMHSPKNCLPGSGWEILESRRVPLELPALRKSIQVNESIIQNGPDSQLVLYWYDTHGRTFASEYEGKAILVWEALRTGRTDGAMIRIMAPVSGPSSKAQMLAADFARKIYPLLKEYLPE